MRVNFNDNNDNKGIEGFYEVTEEHLIFFVWGTNSKADIWADVKCWGRYSKTYGRFVFAGYLKYSKWLVEYVSKISELYTDKQIVVIGHSMGGSIACLVGELLPYVFPVNVDGPACISKVNNQGLTIYNKGSFLSYIPFWFRRYKNTIIYNKTWQPIWKAHGELDVTGIINLVKPISLTK